MIEPAIERNNALHADALVGRLEADDAAIGGWQPDGTDRVGAKGCRAQSGRDRGTGAAARPTRRISQLVGIVRAAVVRVVRRAAECGFVHVQFAQDDGAGLSQPVRHSSIGFGCSGRAAFARAQTVGRRQARNVDVVLERNGDAIQWPKSPPLTGAFAGAFGVRQSIALAQGYVGIQRPADAHCPADEQFGQGDGIDPVLLDQRREVRNRGEGKVVHKGRLSSRSMLHHSRQDAGHRVPAWGLFKK